MRVAASTRQSDQPTEEEIEAVGERGARVLRKLEQQREEERRRTEPTVDQAHNASIIAAMSLDAKRERDEALIRILHPDGGSC